MPDKLYSICLKHIVNNFYYVCDLDDVVNQRYLIPDKIIRDLNIEKK